jgi:hypothetical protein
VRKKSVTASSNRAQVRDLAGHELLRWRFLDLVQNANQPFTISRNWTVAKAPQQILFPRHLDSSQRKLVARLNEARFLPKFLHRAAKAVGHSEAELHDGVEVGAFHLRLRSGRTRSAIHTSCSTDGIDNQDLLSSLAGLFRTYSIELEEVVSFEYFHTHPSRDGHIPDPISADDERVMMILKRHMRAVLGPRIPPIHCYAIGRMDGQTFLYHLKT